MKLIIIGIIALIILLSGCTELPPPDLSCEIDEDCQKKFESFQLDAGNEMLRCLGEYRCEEKQCVYTCDIPDVETPTEEELTACVTDSDCIIVETDCCSCSMGGGQKVINKDYENYWREKRLEQCPNENLIACPAVYLCRFGDTKCNQGVCEGVAINDSPEPPTEENCYYVPETGPCKANFTKYYFDPIDLECKEFIWGGCRGVVPFETLEECNQICEFFEPHPQTEEACIDSGGEWDQHCGLIRPCCNFKTSDFGQECTIGEECEGICLAETSESVSGTCSEWTAQFGCHNLFGSDGSIQAMCID